MSVPSTRVTGWLHDDTEEDLVGADWHQDAIRALSAALDDVAAEAELPWHVGDQLTLVVTWPDGLEWRPMPDIMVHPTAGRERRREMSVARDGVPALIIEVASPATWAYDVDAIAGKASGYMAMGVPFYLVFDPLGDLLADQCRGWRRVDGGYETWQPAEDGRWYVPELDIALMPEGPLLRIFDRTGEPVLFGFERRQAMRKQARLVRELRQAMREQALLAREQQEAARERDRRIGELEAELRRLRGEG